MSPRTSIHTHISKAITLRHIVERHTWCPVELVHMDPAARATAIKDNAVDAIVSNRTLDWDRMVDLRHGKIYEPVPTKEKSADHKYGLQLGPKPHHSRNEPSSRRPWVLAQIISATVRSKNHGALTSFKRVRGPHRGVKVYDIQANVAVTIRQGQLGVCRGNAGVLHTGLSVGRCTRYGPCVWL